MKQGFCVHETVYFNLGIVLDDRRVFQDIEEVKAGFWI